MSLITGNLRQMVKTPASNQVTIRTALWPVIVGNALIVPDTRIVPANAAGFWMSVLDHGYYDISVTGASGQTATVTISVPDDDLTYSFEQLVVSNLPIPSAPIGGAQPTASPSVLGIIKADDAVATPVAATGWFYKVDIAAGRAIANAANNKVLVIRSTGDLFGWEAASLNADDGVNVLKPDDTAGGSPGRWEIKVAGSGGSGSVIFGTGDPEGVVTANQGTWRWATDLPALHLKISGSGNTGWQEITG